MASKSIADRWTVIQDGKRVRSGRYGQGKQWRARYRDANGKEHARHFERKIDAQRWLDEVTASIVTGQYVDPSAGRVTFKTYAEAWRTAQVHRAQTVIQHEGTLRRHVYPYFGDYPLAEVTPSMIQAWVKRLSVNDLSAARIALAPSTIGLAYKIVGSIFRTAVRDRKIMTSPCDGIKLPKVSKARVRPLTTEQVEILRDGMPVELRALVILAAGTGMRQGELFGVTRDRLRLLGKNPSITVDRQLVSGPGGATQFGPPKTEASNRVIPLPRVVVAALNEHIAYFGVGDGELLFTLRGKPLTRGRFGWIWQPVAREAKLNAETGTGVHSLRHYYASLLIRFGESVKTVQDRLGHASATETLDTYSHLWPDSDDRTRDAIDSVLGAAESASGPLADSPRTGHIA